MFSVCNIDFSNGCYAADGRINGAELMIMSERETAEQYISEFRRRYWPSADPNDIIAEINDDFDIDQEHLMPTTIEYINKQITKIIRSY